jgi:ABC-type Mn2+/Zn2+ transport system permease subunit
VNSSAQPKKRGILDAVLALISAALIISPSYVAYELMSRFKVAISTAAILALAIFLVGAFLLVRLLKD